VGAPLDRSATWPYEDGEPGRFSYARADHPTGVACEKALGTLDGGHALLYPSGMGAVTTVVLTGDRLLRPRVLRRRTELAQPRELCLGRVVPGRHRAEPNERSDDFGRQLP